MRSPGNASAPPTAVMPFGVHRGKGLSEIPADYFVWLLGSNVRLGSGFRREIQADLDRRRVEGDRLRDEGERLALDDLPVTPAWSVARPLPGRWDSPPRP